MEYIMAYASLALFFIFWIFKIFNRKNYRLPPSPAAALPLIGHLHLLKPPLHRTFHRFSQTHGPIFSLKIGVRRVVVVSAPNLVQECFSTNDVVFSNRPQVLVDKYMGYNHTTMAGAPYGHHWRNLRRLGALEVLAATRLDAFSELRQDEMRRTLQNLTHTSDFAVVKLRPKIFALIYNMIISMLAGKGYSSDDRGDGKLGDEIHEMVDEVFECAQQSNPEDFVPLLKWIDYRGLKKKLAHLGKRLDDFYELLLAEHRREKRKTIIGHLLSLQESDPEFYTDQSIKGFVTNMVIAGTDTSTVTIEWAMSLLLNHPKIFQKAKLELDSKVGHNRLVEEQDLPKLTYLRNIISETLRLFPAGPLGLPRESSADCKVGGYDIPRGTMLLVNAWAIHRDSNVWDDEMEFKPERFESMDQVKVETMLGFGMGRRACPGSGLAQRMVGLALASFIQCFDWKRVDAEEVDLAEGVGLTMPKLKPLEALCRPRNGKIIAHST